MTVLTLTLALAFAGSAPDVLDRMPEARTVLAECAEVGCDHADGARAAWLVALGTYLETGTADSELAATVALLDPDLFAELPDVVQQAATDPAAWALEPAIDLEIVAPNADAAALLPIGGPLPRGFERILSRHVRADLTVSPPADLPELRARLQARASSCATPLDAVEQQAIQEALPEGRLYVTAPNETARDTQAWRFDRDSGWLIRVSSVGPRVLPRAEGTVHVLLLPWAEGVQGVELDKLPDLVEGPVDAEVLDADRDLVEVLLEHPNECVALSESPETRDALQEIAESYDGTVYFAVGTTKRFVLAWHWDSELEELLRVETGVGL